jgi:L-threonylcarbamoyladenylate synthase
MARTVSAADLPAGTNLLTMPIEPADYGRALYASLRRLDDGDFDIIVIEQPPSTEAWRAVNDRLGRASHGASS